MAVDMFEKAPSVEEVAREVTRIKSMITEAVDDGVRSAMKAVKQGRQAAEDAVHDTKKAVKANPLEAVGIAFAAGILTGVVAALIGKRRR
jgi:ElaB/YqjD/DUF883 family membrane-anchored ribosome-binding protein